MTIVIPVHSFVDLITNSSSEVFVSASQSTVNAIKKLLNNILELAGSEMTADDLFEIELGYEVQSTKDYDQKFVTKKEFAAIKKAWDKFEGNEDEEDDDEENPNRPEFEPAEDSNGYSNTGVIVTPKDSASKEAKDAAKVLSDLTGLFTLDATYN